jgi:DNA-binding GntR family transcriptional regulator
MIERPPSAMRAAPVTKDASSDASHKIGKATLRAAPNAARGRCERITEEELREIEKFVRASKDTKDDVLAIKLLRLDEEFHERLARAVRLHITKTYQ